MALRPRRQAGDHGGARAAAKSRRPRRPGARGPGQPAVSAGSAVADACEGCSSTLEAAAAHAATASVAGGARELGGWCAQGCRRAPRPAGAGERAAHERSCERPARHRLLAAPLPSSLPGATKLCGARATAPERSGRGGGPRAANARRSKGSRPASMQSKGGRRRGLELGNGGATGEALARRASGREGRGGGEPSGSRWAPQEAKAVRHRSAWESMARVGLPLPCTCRSRRPGALRSLPLHGA